MTRRRRSVAFSLAAEVVCPRCGAAPNTTCRGPRGGAIAYHAERIVVGAATGLRAELVDPVGQLKAALDERDATRAEVEHLRAEVDRFIAALAELRSAAERVVNTPGPAAGEMGELYAVLAYTTSDLAAAHDRRVRAEALRLAAKRVMIAMGVSKRMSNRTEMAAWLQSEAERIERGGK